MIIRLPELIREYLDKNEVTQKQFAKDTGISEASLSRLLNSTHTQIDIRTLEKLHKTLNLDYGDLIAVEE